MQRNGHDPSPWKWQPIEVNGQEFKVRSLPPGLADAATAKLPIPRPPIREIKSQLPGGGVERREDPDDPEYKQKFLEVMEQRELLLQRFGMAWCIDAEPPVDEEWGEIQREIEKYLPDIQWGEESYGKKADYIRYVLLGDTNSWLKVWRFINGLDVITSQEVESVEGSFRDQARTDAVIQ